MLKLKNILVMLFVAVIAVGSANAQTLIWSEEFDGPSIDKEVWSYTTGGSGFGNGELQYYTALPQNAYISNGNLVIEARDEVWSGKEFTSARLHTAGRVFFKYGLIEASVKIPDLREGLWPAFWMMGNNYGQVGWPACGEVDILEIGMESARLDGVTNRRNGATAHWEYDDSYAGYGGTITASEDLNNDYHKYTLSWDPDTIRAYLDDVQFWSIDISSGAAGDMEEFHNPYYLIMNLAVGGSNFVNITDPALITAPFPAKLYVDWIRIYDNGYTVLTEASDIAETGNFGILTETTPVNNSVTYDGVHEDLFVWNNMTPTTTTPYEGSSCWSYDMANGAWFGMGVFCHEYRNMQNYSDGTLRFHMKTTTTFPMSVGISSAAGEGWADDLDAYGLVRDGAWHQVVIPLNRISDGVDFHTITQAFMIKGGTTTEAFNVSIDDVYWEPDVTRPAPENGNFGVYTETAANKTAGSYQLGVDGEFYIWDGTLIPATQHPYEGSSCLSYETAPGLGWFGAAYTPFVKYNLTAFRYPESKLHFAMRTTSTVTFRIGMKSGNIAEIGQKWITFKNGSDPYGFVRDGNWHVVEIPMADITDVVDLAEVFQLFELLGTEGAITNIEIDDICFLNGGDAIPQGGGTTTTTTAATTTTTAATTTTTAATTTTTAATTTTTAAGYSLPALIEAEDYTSMSGIDTETCSEGGLNVGWIDAGDWMEYAGWSTGGTYTVDYRVASSPGGGQLRLELDGGATQYPTLSVPGTGGWQVWTTISQTVTLPSGTHDIRIYAPTGGWNINWFEFTSGGTTTTTTTSATTTTTAADGDPVVNFTNPSSGATLTDTVAVNAVAYDPDVGTSDGDGISNVVFELLQGSTVIDSKQENIVTYDWSLDTTDYDDGAYTLKATATSNSAGGGTSASTTISVTIANATTTTTAATTTTTAATTTTTAATTTTTAATTTTTAATTTTTAATTTTTAAGGNLALNKPAVSSSDEADGLSADEAVDGNISSRWASEWSDPQWIYVDLGATYSINQVKLLWELACGEEYKIQVSANSGGPWTDCIHITDNTTYDTWLTHDFSTISGRYVRMYGIQRTTGWGYSIKELEVYGP